MPDSSKTPPQTMDELKELLANDDKVAGVDIDGILRGKIMTKDKFLQLTTVPVTATDTKELKISNLENGYRDLNARIDLDSYRRTPTEPSLPFFLITFLEPDTGETLSACPRGMLQRVAQQLTDSGFEAYAGAEYEYFQFRETPDSVAAKNFHDLKPLTSGMHGYSLLRPSLNSDYFHALYDNCASFGIPLEGKCIGFDTDTAADADVSKQAIIQRLDPECLNRPSSINQY
ncbi:hypothetical protein OIV83_002509 [Microbotryomycetes sp. JL201]|nr:hypothetical protein OIV83_002509 [Microbotryomycetes sp. JL201]